MLLLAGALSACGKTDESRSQITYYRTEEGAADLTLENERLRLTVSAEDTSIVLTDKLSGAVWQSVPEGAASDALADASTRKSMLSPLLLKYEDEKGNASTYDGYTYAVEGRTFELAKEGDRIIVRYTVGPADRSYMIPEAVTEERMMSLLGRMDDAGKGVVMRNYLKIDLEKVRDQSKRSSYEQAVPALADGPMYLLPQLLPGGSVLREYQLVQLEEIFASIGYTEEEYEQDRVQQEAEEGENIRYNVTLEYYLDGDSLRLDIPLSEIRYPADYPVTEIRPLPYLCHADDQDQGYMLIPDGGGAQIFFHNGKGRNSAYYADFYGYDEVIERKLRIQDTKADFPVYAIAKNGSYLMAIITDGSADMGVEADVGGKRSNYDYVRPVVKVLHGATMDISVKSVSTVKVFQGELSDDTVSIRFVSGSGDSYAQMAARYREDLEERYPGALGTSPEGTPLVVEFAGAIDHIEKFAGIPVHRTYVAADYAEVAEAVRALAGVKNLSVRYTDIFNGGANQKALMDADYVGGLGSTGDREELVSLIRQQGGRLYLGAYVEQVRSTGLFDGYSPLDDAIRDVSNTVIERYPYYVDTLNASSDGGLKVALLGAAAQEKTFAALQSAAISAGAGVSYMDAGRLLYSDFGTSSYTSRNAFAVLQSRLIAGAASECGVLVDGGNEYAAVYGDCVIGLDLAGSRYDIVDRQVPFYEMALHGSVAYTGSAVNVTGELDLAVLRAAETGAGLYFRFFETDYEEIRYNSVTYTDTLYGANFADWKDKLLAAYDRLESRLGGLGALRITDHEYLSDGVTQTTYEDGTRVIVNYTQEPFAQGGVRVDARDFAVVGRGE